MQAEDWVAVAFFILLGVFAYFGIHRTVLRALDHRRDRIKDELDDARKLKDEARAEAERLATEAKTRMEEFVARRTRMAETKIAQAEAQAVADVRSAAADAAVAAASKILGDTLKGSAADALISQGISEVRQKLN